MIQMTTDTRAGKDDSGACIGIVTVVMNDDAYQALAAAVEIAFDDPLETPAEYEESAKELWAFFHPNREAPVES